MWHLTCDTWNVTHDAWYVTHGGGEYSLKISALQLLRFGIDSDLKILNERMTESMNEWINDEGVYRTAPDLLITGILVPGLLFTSLKYLVKCSAEMQKRINVPTM